MMNNPARFYRQMSCQGASRVGLVVILYEVAMGCLHRAVKALEANNIEARTRELNHFLAVIGYLHASLDMARGGEVARALDRFYHIARVRILQANLAQSKAGLEEIAAHFNTLREAWEQVDRSVGSSFPQPETEK